MVPLLEMGFTPGQIDSALEAVPDNGSRTVGNLINWLIEHPLTDEEVRDHSCRKNSFILRGSCFCERYITK